MASTSSTSSSPTISAWHTLGDNDLIAYIAKNGSDPQDKFSGFETLYSDPTLLSKVACIAAALGQTKLFRVFSEHYKGLVNTRLGSLYIDHEKISEVSSKKTGISNPDNMEGATPLFRKIVSSKR